METIKKTLLLAIILLFAFSCKDLNSKNSRNSFRGIGELIIGNKINSIPSFKSFKKIRENEYRSYKYELTYDSGIVEDVVVKTTDGKISNVSFSAGKFTHQSNIDNTFLGIVLEKNISELGEKPHENYIRQSFETDDEKVSISKITYFGINSITRYSYYERESK